MNNNAAGVLQHFRRLAHDFFHIRGGHGRIRSLKRHAGLYHINPDEFSGNTDINFLDMRIIFFLSCFNGAGNGIRYAVRRIPLAVHKPIVLSHTDGGNAENGTVPGSFSHQHEHFGCAKVQNSSRLFAHNAFISRFPWSIHKNI